MEIDVKSLANELRFGRAIPEFSGNLNGLSGWQGVYATESASGLPGTAASIFGFGRVGYNQQIAMRNGSMLFRTQENSVWSSWFEVAKASALDDMVRKSTTGLGVTGNVALDGITNTASKWAELPVGYTRMMSSSIGTAGGAPEISHGYFFKVANRDSGGGWTGLWLGHSSLNSYIGRATTSSDFATWSKIWTDRNDGAGSGLDADLLDGQHGAHYLNTANHSGTTSPKVTNAAVTILENIASYNGTTIPDGYIKLVTPIRTSHNQMFSIDIFGYDYSGSETIDFTVVGYAYGANDAIISFGLSNRSTFKREVRLALEDRGDGYRTMVVLLGAESGPGTSQQAWYYQKFTAHARGWAGNSANWKSSDFQFVVGETTLAAGYFQTPNLNNLQMNGRAGTINASGAITAGSFVGPVTGNASTATKLVTARTINGTAFDGSGNITTANWGTARTLTIGSTGKSVDGSANISWTLAEIGAAPLASPALTGAPTAPTAALNTNTTQLATTAYVIAAIADDAPTKTGGGASGTWGIGITGTAAAANRLAVRDTRAVESTPNSEVAPGLYADFKTNETSGLTDGGTYAGLITFRQYGTANDWSGGPAHQFGFSANGNVWHRFGTSTTWGVWNKMWSSGNHGAGSGLDADKLDGLEGAHYLNYANFTGTVPTWNQNTTGNSATATALATARTINGTSFNGSSNITTANWGTSRTITIGGAAKAVNGSGNVSWTLAEMGAAPIASLSDYWLKTELLNIGTTAATARTALGLGTMAVEVAANYYAKSELLNIGTTAATARTALGLGTMATASASEYTTTANLNTGVVAEGANLYHTTARVRTVVESMMGAVNGLASLGADGKLSTAQLPALAITDTYPVASQAAMLALTAERGDVAIRSDTGVTYILKQEPANVLANWLQLTTPTDGVLSFNGRAGTVVPAAGDYTFAMLGSKPTTLAGYGITDAAAASDLSGKAPVVHTHAVEDVDGLLGSLAGKLSNSGPNLMPASTFSLAMSTVAGSDTGIMRFHPASSSTATRSAVLELYGANAPSLDAGSFRLASNKDSTISAGTAKLYFTASEHSFTGAVKSSVSVTAPALIGSSSVSVSDVGYLYKYATGVLGLRATGTASKYWLFNGNDGNLEVSNGTVVVGASKNAVWHAGNLLNIGTTAASARTALGLGTMALEVAANYTKTASLNAAIDGLAIKNHSLASGVDLNTQTTSGVYVQATNANATLVLNYPVAAAGWLEVLVRTGGQYIIQRYTHYSTGVVYSRSNYNGTWSPWRQLLDSVGDVLINGLVEASGTAAVLNRVNRTGNTTNALYEAKTTGGSVYFGQGRASRFAVGTSTDLATNWQFEVDGNGVRTKPILDAQGGIMTNTLTASGAVVVNNNSVRVNGWGGIPGDGVVYFGSGDSYIYKTGSYYNFRNADGNYSASLTSGGTIWTSQIVTPLDRNTGGTIASSINLYAGSVSTQIGSLNLGWNNGVRRWSFGLEANGAMSLWSYDANGNYTALPLSVGSSSNGGENRLTVNGNVYGWDFILISDSRLKEDVKPLIANARLRPVEYLMTPTGHREYGFIAQELLEAYPDAVHMGVDGYYGVKYQRLVPVLSAQLNDATDRVAALENDNKLLAERLARVEALLQKLQ